MTLAANAKILREGEDALEAVGRVWVGVDIDLALRCWSDWEVSDRGPDRMGAGY
jgi:hypothetical protein